MPERCGKSTPKYLASILSLSIFTAWLIIGGCQSRLVDNESQICDLTPGQTIKVLLSSSKPSHEVMPAGNCLITSIYEDKSMAGVSINVSVSNSVIKINGKTAGQRVELEPRGPAVFALDGKRYRGKIIFEAKDGNLLAINELPIETYLAGVVGAEMPPYWNLEALKAQTIAARTYAIFIKDKFGANRSWDVRNTQANQVYNGIDAEHTQIWAAVNATYGLVLTCQDSKHPNNIFPAYFSSTCGGHTENSKNVFGDKYSALCGVECPYCVKTAGKKVFHWSDYKIDKEAAFEKLCDNYPSLKKLEKLASIEPVRKSKYQDFERITRFKINGTNKKSDIVGGEDMRLTLDPTGRKLKSPACDFKITDDELVFTDGRGFGHGVGLCQYGALGMARKGYLASSILSYYYPGSITKRIY